MFEHEHLFQTLVMILIPGVIQKNLTFEFYCFKKDTRSYKKSTEKGTKKKIEPMACFLTPSNY